MMVRVAPYVIADKMDHHNIWVVSVDKVVRGGLTHPCGQRFDDPKVDGQLGNLLGRPLIEEQLPLKGLTLQRL
jgi:hypothetical protein